jgi:hypothetical protein
MPSEVESGIMVVDIGRIAESEMSVAPEVTEVPVACGYGTAVTSAANALIKMRVRILLVCC